MYSGFECPTVANVFHEPGTLSAVGTYTEEDDSTIVIEIWDAEFTEVIYSQTVEVPFKGYHVFELDEPIDVTGRASAGKSDLWTLHICSPPLPDARQRGYLYF